MPSFRKIVFWLLVAFLLYAIFRSPDQAAQIVGAGWDGIVAGFSAVAAFFDALLTG